MSAPVPRSRWLARYAVLLGMWLGTVLLMLQDYAGDPYDPLRTGTSAYGHNSQDILGTVLPLTVGEILFALIILRPRSYRASWGRAVLAFVVLFAWGLFSLAISMHAGGVVMLHGLWVVALALACLVAAIWS